MSHSPRPGPTGASSGAGLHDATADVAIIGGGLSGTLLAVQLLRVSRPPPRVLLVERGARPGLGVAYGTRCGRHLLNVVAGRMSALPDDPDHFVRWACERDASITADTFVPRMIFGEYVASLLDAARDASADRFEHFRADAVALEPGADGVVIRLSDGRQLACPAVALALGNFPPADPPVADGGFYTRSARYVRDPWAAGAFDAIKPDEPLLLIGTGLTAIDVMLELDGRGYRGPMVAISRHGFQPAAHKLVPSAVLHPIRAEPGLGLRKARRRVVDACREAGDGWRPVFDSLRPQTQPLWQSLTVDERRRFLRHLRAFWDVHRHRVAPQIAAFVDELRAGGRLTLCAARICSYREEPGRVLVSIRRRGDSDATTVAAGHVINCTGPDGDYRRCEQPLIASLRGQGLIRCDAFGLGLEADAQGALLDAQGRPSRRLFSLGPPIKGMLWESTAAAEIREQAARLARRLAHAD